MEMVVNINQHINSDFLMQINSHVTESVEVTVLKQTNEEENVPSPLNLRNTVSCRENKTPEETQNGIDLLYCGTHNNNYASKRSDNYRLSRKYPNDTFSNGCTNFGSFVRPTKLQNRRKVSQHLTCNICGKYFATRPGLYLHRRKHKEGYQFECDTCSRKFMDKQTLKEHLLTHMIVKPYLCQTCGKHFSRHSRLKKHLMKHSLETVRPKHYFTCSFCEEVFISEEIALKHAKIGHGNVTELHFSHGLIDRVFLCEYCERCFVSHQALNCHRESHAPLYVFSCIVCRSTFPTFSRLQTHKIAHSSENATDGFEVPSYYACTACDKSYLHWTNLTVHWKLQHDKIKYMYHCKQHITTSNHSVIIFDTQIVTENSGGNHELEGWDLKRANWIALTAEIACFNLDHSSKDIDPWVHALTQLLQHVQANHILKRRFRSVPESRLSLTTFELRTTEIAQDHPKTYELMGSHKDNGIIQYYNGR
ncbi:zinc finger protein 26-like [Schistocerca cancellata]|uniref:zinc finger protein 26-like n=1 Tax=Schistocerca cancellata TaxID=274614 RepID=UPI0021187CCB|nr:zinc finger protein 26-like [Schistocerca cancellata]